MAQVGEPDGVLRVARKADDGRLGDRVDDGERHLHALHGSHNEAEAGFVGLLHGEQETVGVAGGLQAAGCTRGDAEQLRDGLIAVDGGLEVAGAGGSSLRQRELVGDRRRGGGGRQRDVGVGGAGEGSDDLGRARGEDKADAGRGAGSASLCSEDLGDGRRRDGDRERGGPLGALDEEVVDVGCGRVKRAGGPLPDEEPGGLRGIVVGLELDELRGAGARTRPFAHARRTAVAAALAAAQEETCEQEEC